RSQKSDRNPDECEGWSAKLSSQNCQAKTYVRRVVVIIWPAMKAVCALTLFVAALFAQAPVRSTLWAPKPDKTPKYIPPHKPLTKLADVRAAHAGKSNWNQVVVDDNVLHGEWVSSAPGTKTSKALHPDTRTFWIIEDGQIRFDIEGQQPFTA